MYDLIIIGAGPAGISASLYAKRANLNVAVLYHGKSNLEQAEKIDNYYGFENGIDANKLYNDGIKQAKNIGVDVKEEEVLNIEKLGEIFKVSTTQSSYEAKTVILATGNKKVRPNIEGVAEFEGRGISYCAICDGFFYRNKNVVVIGNGNFAVNEAKELENIVGNITILTNGLEIENESNFEVNLKKIKKISGQIKVEMIEFEDGTTMDVDGIFIALGEAGASDFAKKLGVITNGDTIKVNEKMETNIAGLYACGNVTGGLLQICKAVYEGAEAALEAVSYVRKNKEKR